MNMPDTQNKPWIYRAYQKSTYIFIYHQFQKLSGEEETLPIDCDNRGPFFRYYIRELNAHPCYYNSCHHHFCHDPSTDGHYCYKHIRYRHLSYSFVNSYHYNLCSNWYLAGYFLNIVLPDNYCLSFDFAGDVL